LQVSSIHALSAGSPAEHQTLSARLKAAEESLARAAGAAGGATIAEALNALDPTQHTLGCIYFLCVRCAVRGCCLALRKAARR
jgi:hypothetical protein